MGGEGREGDVRGRNGREQDGRSERGGRGRI